MQRKSCVSTTLVIFLGLALLPPANSHAQSMPMPAGSQGTQAQKYHEEMMSHQKEMDDLLARSQKDFQAVVTAKDARGYVRDKAVLNVYKADLDALRDAVRQHKLLTADYVGWCGPEDKKHNAMMEHQQRMKSLLYDLVDTFDTYVKADDTSIDQPFAIEEAFDAQQDALKEFADAIQQHKQAMTQMMAKCS
ncbi:MAG TPA: hypothetical protein VE866_06260 [Candidatus Binatia bacterium]|nr:hypothetical protein [Candidatus Binatia bacterium]